MFVSLNDEKARMSEWNRIKGGESSLGQSTLVSRPNDGESGHQSISIDAEGSERLAFPTRRCDFHLRYGNPQH